MYVQNTLMMAYMDVIRVEYSRHVTLQLLKHNRIRKESEFALFHDFNIANVHVIQYLYGNLLKPVHFMLYK